MSQVHLGKLLLRWCPQCDLPILESKKCSTCGCATEKVEITPPGDIRPAFERDIELIRNVVDRQFGEGTGIAVLPKGKIVVLNKVPAFDRMDEVILDGEVVGSFRFDLTKGWVFMSRMPAARAMQGVLSKRFVEVDDGAVVPIVKSSNLLVPGIVSASPEITAGDEVILLNKEHIPFGTGMARMSYEEMMTVKKGLAVKVRWTEMPVVHVPRQTVPRTWADAVAANKDGMDSAVKEAVSFIHRVVKEKAMPTVVSLSGGKDSLASLILTLKAGYKFPIFFIDTGLEFPETVEHVKALASKHGLELIIAKAPEDAFNEGFKAFGPPGRDFRWCCKTNKLGPTSRAVLEHYPLGVLSFIGQRRYESELRSSKPRVWINPWTPGQIGASPIQHWTALHVWLLIFAEKEEYNPWYEMGLDRIGCFLCPASDLAELRMIERSPRFTEWKSTLMDYAEKRGLPKEWVEYGAWRWRKIPQSFSQELQRVNVDITPTERLREAGLEHSELRLLLQPGVSPCTMGFSIEGAFDRELDMVRVANVLNMIGEPAFNKEEGWCMVNDITIFESGALIAKGKEEKIIREKVERVRRAVVKAEECVSCGVCVARCCEGALRLTMDRIVIDVERCVHCGRCFEPCPAITFGDNTFDF